MGPSRTAHQVELSGTLVSREWVEGGLDRLDGGSVFVSGCGVEKVPIETECVRRKDTAERHRVNMGGRSKEIMRKLEKEGEDSRTETTKRAVIAMSGRCGAPTASSLAADFVHA